MVFGASQKSNAVFHAAQRHSMRVRVLKTALPLTAVAVAAVFSWYTFLAAPASTVKVELDPSESGKLVMTSPQLNGYTKDNRPYSMVAQRAVQDAKQSGVIALEGIKAQLPVGDKDKAEIDAQSGVYDSVNGHLQFDNDFTVKTTGGMEAKLRSASVNMSSGEMSTDKPVDIRTGNAHISADKMQVQENGKVVVFEHKVHLTIEPASDSEPAKSPAGGDSINN
ncbi:LPS export ABC transporter periplasmic protein LptC [Pseudochrobactrum sp. MP213Fo]|uniref:LPS export ABC transporter periplasmic protein LptC n=1 Tax=Pseudochrobactrum sp. MP213Fo TaxID=3022250 RepID=UPI003BA0F6C1